MTKIIVTIVLLVTSQLFSQSQFEQGMGKAFALWGEGKNTEASAVFERIASAEKESWLPNYYVALVNTTAAFKTKDYNQVNHYLSRAQKALDHELTMHPDNAELLVLQAMVHTAWISYDPMTYGQTLSAKVMQLYSRAGTLAPENPRVILSKAQFEIGSARFFGTDVKPICAQVERSIDLFDNFKPESQFHPSWGKQEAMQTLNTCI